MRLTTENEQFEHLNKAEVQAKPVTKFIDPWMVDIVDSGIGLLYRPASLCSLAGRYDNPMPGINFITPR